MPDCPTGGIGIFSRSHLDVSNPYHDGNMCADHEHKLRNYALVKWRLAKASIIIGEAYFEHSIGFAGRNATQLDELEHDDLYPP